MGRLVAGEELDRGSAEAALIEVGTRLGLPRSEAKAAVKSGLVRGAKSPKRASRHRVAPRRLPSVRQEWAALKDVLFLLADSTWPLEWTLAKRFATMPRELVRQDLLTSWDTLANLIDIPRVWATQALLRTVAQRRFPSTEPASAVRCLLNELEAS